MKKWDAASQHEKLKEVFAYVRQHSNFYKKQFENLGILSLETMTDFYKIPFTTKEDVAKYNDDFLCVPKIEVSDFVTTSGTLGEPVTFYLTQKDLDRLGENEAFSLSVAGGTAHDIYQLMTTMDKRFMAGVAYYSGVLKMKAGMVRVGPGAAFLQWDSIKRFSPTVLIAIPSFIPKLIEFAKAEHIDFRKTSIKSIVCIGEPIREADFTLNDLGKIITTEWPNVKLYSTYASTEMSTSFTECEAGQGGHLNDELLFLEVVDENDEQVKNGQAGEIVITTLGVEGMPLLRYKTGDVCNYYNEPCTCGRNTPRLGPVIGRKKQMFKYKGTTFFPSSIINTLSRNNITDNYVIEITKDKFNNDYISIILPNELELNTELLHQLDQSFKSTIRVIPKYKFLSMQHLNILINDEKNRKPQRLIDKR